LDTYIFVLKTIPNRGFIGLLMQFVLSLNTRPVFCAVVPLTITVVIHMTVAARRPI